MTRATKLDVPPNGKLATEILTDWHYRVTDVLSVEPQDLILGGQYRSTLQTNGTTGEIEDIVCPHALFTYC